MLGKRAFVYVLTAPDGRGAEYVKVGVTTDWKRRLCNLRHGLPFDVESMFLLALPSMMMAKAVEAELLIAFKDKATRGEWFMFLAGERGHMKIIAEGAAEATEQRAKDVRWEFVDVRAPIGTFVAPPKTKKRTANYRGSPTVTL